MTQLPHAPQPCADTTLEASTVAAPPPCQLGSVSVGTVTGTGSATYVPLLNSVGAATAATALAYADCFAQAERVRQSVAATTCQSPCVAYKIVTPAALPTTTTTTTRRFLGVPVLRRVDATLTCQVLVYCGAPLIRSPF